MDFSTLVLSSLHNQTDPVRSIALHNPKRPRKKIQKKILSTCIADWAAHSSQLLWDVYSLSLSICHGEFRKSCGWHSQTFWYHVSERKSRVLPSLSAIFPPFPFSPWFNEHRYLQFLNWPFCLYPVFKLNKVTDNVRALATLKIPVGWLGAQRWNKVVKSLWVTQEFASGSGVQLDSSAKHWF